MMENKDVILEALKRKRGQVPTMEIDINVGQKEAPKEDTDLAPEKMDPSVGDATEGDPMLMEADMEDDQVPSESENADMVKEMISRMTDHEKRQMNSDAEPKSLLARAKKMAAEGMNK